jgi:hypothetical protein
MLLHVTIARQLYLSGSVTSNVSVKTKRLTEGILKSSTKFILKLV